MATFKITQVETHITEADSENEVLQLWNEGAIDGGGTLDVTIVKLDETPVHTFTFLSGETYDVKASNLAEAQERLDAYLCRESEEHVTEGETLTELINRPCLECPPDSHGWHKGDDPGITFEGLKKAQNEAIVQGIKYAMDYLEDINAHHSANALADFLDYLTENTFVPIPEWQREFFAKHSFYSTECEGSN